MPLSVNPEGIIEIERLGDDGGQLFYTRLQNDMAGLE
jgi:hypothetical protein